MQRKRVRVSEVLSFSPNPLLRGISKVQSRIEHFKEEAKQFYFKVLLSQYVCPTCGAELSMTGESVCTCSSGHSFDPTLTCQRSACCGANLVRKTFHYACSRCRRIVPSRFLFDERVFDKAYFRMMMRECRERLRNKREEIRRLLAESRSGVLQLMEEPSLEFIPGLIQDLDDFIQPERFETFDFSLDSGFRMDRYRDHILSLLGWDRIQFSDISPLADDSRQDKAWRFITLIFMDNEREVELTQYGRDLWVQRAYHETDEQGQGFPGAAEIAP